MTKAEFNFAQTGVKNIKEAIKEKNDQLKKLQEDLRSIQSKSVKELTIENIDLLKKEIKVLKENLFDFETNDELINKNWEKEYEKYPVLEQIHKDTISIGGSKKFNDNRMLNVSLERLKAGYLKSLILEGATGTGKTTAIRWLGAKCNRPVISVNASNGIEEENILGKYSIVNNKPKWVDGPLVIAMKTGSIFVLEEINAMKPSVAIILNSVLDDLGQIQLEHGELVKSKKGFAFCATLNYGYAGTREMNKALLNRFQISIVMQSMSEKKMNKILEDRLNANETEKRIVWYIYKSIVNALKERGFDNNILSIRQIFSLIENKRIEKLIYEKDEDVSIWINSLNMTVRNQVATYDEDVNKIINLTIKALKENFNNINKNKEVDPLYETSKSVDELLGKKEGK